VFFESLPASRTLLASLSNNVRNDHPMNDWLPDSAKPLLKQHSFERDGEKHELPERVFPVSFVAN